VKSQRKIGIYISKLEAVTIAVDCSGDQQKVQSCFKTVLDNPDKSINDFVDQIANGIAENIPNYADAQITVALDCELYMQHSMHSEFQDPKQISQTVKFDAEDTLSTDISELALAFDIDSMDDTGSQLKMFTAQQKLLSKVINRLQVFRLDPVAVIPDVVSLWQFIRNRVQIVEDAKPVFAAISTTRGYMIIPLRTKDRDSTVMRSFLVSADSDRNDLIARQIPLTLAQQNGPDQTDGLIIFDSADSADPKIIHERLALQSTLCDPLENVTITPEMLEDCSDKVQIAIAYGAAVNDLHNKNLNFRTDFMPYEGKKAQIERALKLISISLIVIVLSLGTYFQMNLIKVKSYQKQVSNKLKTEYEAVMMGSKMDTRLSPVKKLKGELERVKREKKGELGDTGKESVTARLVLVLEAVNKSAKQTDLNINMINITSRSISLVGDTSGRRQTLNFNNALKTKMNVEKQNYELKGSRDTFNFTLSPK